MRKWEELPADMQVPEVRRYYDILQRHKGSLILKRIFDIIAAGEPALQAAVRYFGIAGAAGAAEPGVSGAGHCHQAGLPRPGVLPAGAGDPVWKAVPDLQVPDHGRSCGSAGNPGYYQGRCQGDEDREETQGLQTG